jgi:hypothetical protein
VVGGIADYFGLAGEDLLTRRKKTEAERKTAFITGQVLLVDGGFSLK